MRQWQNLCHKSLKKHRINSEVINSFEKFVILATIERLRILLGMLTL